MDNKDKKYWLTKIKNDSDEKILQDILMSEDSQDVFSDVYDIHLAAKELKDWKEFDKISAWKNISENAFGRRLSVIRYLSAAVLVLIIGFTMFFINSKESYSAGDVEKHFVLVDGSDIVLYPHSKLIVSNDFNEHLRKVELEGDGYFNISKNINKPFVIEMNQANIKVLGTVFYVDQMEKGVKVDLLKGKVEIENDNEEKTIITDEETAFITEKVEVEKLDDSKLPVSNDLFLNDISIKAAVNKLNDIYGKKIIILKDTENDFWDKPIHMTVRNSSIREFINGLELVFNVKIVNSKGRFTVSSLKMR